MRGYRALGHPETQLPRLFSARVHGYRVLFAPECAVTARCRNPHARLPRGLAPEQRNYLRFYRPRARSLRFFSNRARGYRAFLLPACAVTARFGNRKHNYPQF